MTMPKIVLGLALAALAQMACAQARADVIIAPVAGTTTMSEAFPLANAYNQNGLSTGYTSGVTDFSSYIASDPRHTSWFENDWIATSSTGYVILDLGAEYDLDQIAVWNFGGPYGSTDYSTLQFTLEISADAAFTSPTLVGTYNLDVYGAPSTNPAQVFSFTSVTGQYVRLSGFVANAGGAPALGEVAFGAQSTTSVPEPGAMAMLIGGLASPCLLVLRRRMRWKPAGSQQSRKPLRRVQPGGLPSCLDGRPIGAHARG